MEAKRRCQAASAQMLLLPTTELPPLLKCTGIFYPWEGGEGGVFLRRKDNLEVGLHSKPLPLKRWSQLRGKCDHPPAVLSRARATVCQGGQEGKGARRVVVGRF